MQLEEWTWLYCKFDQRGNECFGWEIDGGMHGFRNTPTDNPIQTLGAFVDGKTFGQIGAAGIGNHTNHAAIPHGQRYLQLNCADEPLDVGI